MSVQDNLRRVREIQARQKAAAPPSLVVEPERPAPQMPSIFVDPPDLSPIIAAIQSLKLGVSADEIGQAVARFLPPPAEALDIEQLIKATEKNIQYSYPVAGGGGTVGLRAKAIQDLATALRAPSLANTATLTNVSGSVSSVTLLAANVNRHAFYVHNDSSAILWAKFGTAASATSYTVELIAGAFERFEYPVYTGLVTGIWETATGAARLTEVT